MRFADWSSRVTITAMTQGQPIQERFAFPPGTSKWNTVEHRLFSFISSAWRGEPLRDYETIVRLVAGTTTAKGLTVTCRLDRRRYPVGRKISDEACAIVNLEPHTFHGEWSYSIHPRTRRQM
jgi:hypothetical protein